MNICINTLTISSSKYYKKFVKSLISDLTQMDDLNFYTIVTNEKNFFDAENIPENIKIINPETSNSIFGNETFAPNEKFDLIIYFDSRKIRSYSEKYILVARSLQDIVLDKKKSFFSGNPNQKELEKSLQKAFKIIVYNKEDSQILNEKLNISEDKIEIIEPFLEIEEFSNEKEEIIPINIKLKNNIQNDFFLYDGGDDLSKNVDTIVELMRKIKEENLNYSLVVICEKLNMDVEIRRKSNDYKLQDRIHFISDLKPSELKHFYKESVGFLYIPIYESFPFRTLDAIKYETPIIISSIKSIKDVFSDEVLYVNPLSARDIVNKISSKDFENLKWQKINYEKVLDNNPREKTVSKFGQFLEKVLKEV